MKVNIKLNKTCSEAEAQRLCVVANGDARRAVLKRRTAAGEITHIYGQLYVRSKYWSGLSHVERYRHIIRTLAAMHPTWVFCDMSAAAMFCVNDSWRHTQHIHILNTRQGYTHDYGIIRHHHIPRIEFTVVDAVRVTSLARTVFDCARRYSLPDGLPVIESAIRQGLASKRQLQKTWLTFSAWHQAQAFRALQYARGTTENGGEAYVLGVMIEEGFETPMLQLELPNPADPRKSDRVDYAWRTEDGRLIVAELDGRVKYQDPAMYKNGSLPDTIIAEKEREERVRLVADEMVRFSFAEAMDRTMVVRKLERAGVPRVVSSRVGGTTRKVG